MHIGADAGRWVLEGMELCDLWEYHARGGARALLIAQGEGQGARAVVRFLILECQGCYMGACLSDVVFGHQLFRPFRVGQSAGQW